MALRAATALKEIVRAAGGGAAGATDRELLQRFAESGDQAAFAALFRRHSGMVIGVCRRALSNLQDAEDACQATFLVLARKARSGRWQPSLANWLYLTARRVAHNARMAATRRACREKSAAVPEAVQPVDRMTGRELLAVLDEELDKLPPRYREPLVLCYLEGLTRDEAAARLGVPSVTLKSQLDRGRKRLGDALTRRGCVLGAGLLALAATSPAGASPLRLVERVLATAAGSPSAAVARLAEGAAMNGFGKAKLLALVALVSVVTLGFRVASGQPAGSGQSPEKAMPAKTTAADAKATNPPKAAADRGKEIALTGRVLDPDAKPFPGAKLLTVGEGGATKEVGVSGKDGRFAVSVPVGRPRAFLLAKADGSGLDFLPLGGSDAREVELRLVKDNPIHGRVVDTQGKPMAGVSVCVTAVGVYANDSLDSFLVAWKKRHPQLSPSLGVKHLGIPLSPPLYAAPIAATTDAEGRFTLRGYGVERFVSFHLSGAGIATVECRIVNRAGFDPEPYNEASRNNIPKGLERNIPVQLLNGPDFNVVAEPEKPIRGVVTAADTGKGRPGVTLRLLRYGDAPAQPLLVATTDAVGLYEIHGARKEKAYDVAIIIDPGTEYLSCDVRAADTAGYEPVTANLRTARGVLVTGRVLDSSTGTVIPGRVRGFVYTAVLPDNPFAKDYQLPDKGRDIVSRAITAADGSFRLLAIPGPVILMGGPEGTETRSRYKQAESDPNYPGYFPKRKGYLGFPIYGGGYTLVEGNWCKVLDIKPGTTEVKQDILLEPATALSLRLRDPAGKPVTGVLAAGTATRDWYEPVTCTTDTCTVYEPQSGKRVLVLFEPARKLAAVLKWSENDKLPNEVTLRPVGAVKGRLIDEDGKPLAGVAVDLDYKDRPAEEIHKIARAFRQAVTGTDGSFAVEPVLPGVPHDLTFKRLREQFKLTAKPEVPLTVGSGETRDLGSLTAKVVGENADK